MDEKICDKCKILQPMDKFRKYTDKKNSFSCSCKKCLNEMDKIRKKNKRQKKSESFLAKCEKSFQEKLLKT